MMPRMLARLLVVSLVSLALSSAALSGQEGGGQQKGGQEKGAKEQGAQDSKGKVDVQAELAALPEQIAKAGKDTAKIAAIVTAFAERHRPDKMPVAVLLSTDKKVCVAIGSNGSDKEPAAPTVEFKPVGTVLNVAVGGRGFDAKTVDGGSGGTVVQKAAGKGTTILVGGVGGKGGDGVDGKQEGSGVGRKGGDGGNVWFGGFSGEGVVGVGGEGGRGGNPGGTGGAGGSAGPGPGK